MADRNGNVHSYSRDVLGRTTADAVTTLGGGVDGSIRRIETAYNTLGLPYLYTSFNAASGGSVVNQVQDAYNGLAQLTTEWQSHSGAVNTGTTPKVQYAYTEMAGGANHSRLTSMTYPNGRVITYNYNTGLDSNISRLSSIADGSTTLEAYTYLGLNTAVKRAHPQPGVDLTYIKQTGESNGDAGDQYTGLDRFGRIVDQRWIVSSTGVATDRFQYGYDRDGNVLYKNNLVNSAMSELYHANGAANGYDQLGQLTAFARGTLSDTNSDGVPDTVASASHSQSWSLDALGNWSSVTTDGSTQTRTANQQNEITSISGQTTPGYDANGNMTTDQTGKTLVWDAWNQLAQVKSGQTVLESFAYDAIGRRIIENPGTARDLFFSAAWQVIEERVAGNAVDQYVWSPVNVDAMIERDRDADGNPANGLEERLYVQQDANLNVTGVVSTAGVVQERYIEDPCGQVNVVTAAWGPQGTSTFGWLYFHQGGRYDSTSGLYNFRNREYSPTLGQWASQDPLGYAAGDANFYRTLGNSPPNGTDPSGLDPWWMWNRPLDFFHDVGMLFSGTDGRNAMPIAPQLDYSNPNLPPGLRSGVTIPRENHEWFRDAGPAARMAAAGTVIEIGTERIGGRFLGYLLSQGWELARRGGTLGLRRAGVWLHEANIPIFRRRFAQAAASVPGTTSHHIVSRYSNATRGWQRNWTELAQDILDRARIGIESGTNRVPLPGHQGPHVELYHRRIFERLERAAGNRRGQALTAAVREELQRIADDLLAAPTCLSGVGL